MPRSRLPRLLALAILVPAVSSGEPRPVDETDAREGLAIYERECAACHGERGDGLGPAAPFLDPRPRDFTSGVFRFRTTASGSPPRTEDVLRTIEHGLPGSAMPPYAFLSDVERRRLAAYVLSLSGLLDRPEPEPLELAAPPPATAESVALGEEIYREVECGTCHGAEGRGDGPEVATLRDVDGRPITPRDFTRGLFRGGADRASIFRRISTGVDGTPMPSFADALDEADRWALADFVLSLGDAAAPEPPRDPREAALEIAERTGCRGCHVLADGVGGTIGPDLRESAKRLGRDELEEFLRHPRSAPIASLVGPRRMPEIPLAEREIELLADSILETAGSGR